MFRDPIVEEIHEIRRRLLAECGGDLRLYMERLKRREAEHPDRVVNAQQLKELLEARRKTQTGSSR